MARIRTIKPAFWTDEKLAQVDPLIRLTFLGLISAMADDAGRCKGDARLVKASVWPLDDGITVKTITSHLDRLRSLGRIVVYEVDGAQYVEIVNWKRHQRIDKPQASALPPPPNDSGNVPRLVADGSALDVEVEVEGKRNGSGTDARDSSSPDSNTDLPSAAPPAPLLAALALPKGALDFCAMFYEPAFTQAQRERYRDVVAQLWDALDKRHPGPKIRGGVRVKARSTDHLERECRAVMRDPPMDRDKAVVILLKRLTNPEPGPTPAEQHKAETVTVIAEEESYQRAAKSAGVAWSKANPTEYEPIRAQVDAEFRGKGGDSSFGRMARDAALVQRCARAAAFPDFDTWRKQRGAA